MHAWYPEGTKVIPSGLKINNEIVQVWFADDGSVIAPKDKLNKLQFDIKFATHGFSQKEVDILAAKLSNLYGVKFRVYKEKNGQATIRLFKTADCRVFLRRIDKGFPLARKAAIWRDQRYRLFEDIPPLPSCAFCQSDETKRNGHLLGVQNYRCLGCGRQFTKNTTGLRVPNRNGKYNLKGKYWRAKNVK